MQFKKGFKSVLAVVLSAALTVAPAMTSFATDPSTTPGTGNILDYKVVSQIVPTSLRVAINPNAYPVNIRYAKLADDATFTAGTKYYTESDGEYSIATVTGDTFASLKATLYTAETSNSQIVTFNYGLVNMSTVDQNFNVSLDVEADENVEFVATAAEVASEAAADDGGAKKGEYKVFLKLVPAKVGTAAAITADTYAKATGDYNASGKYFTFADGKYTAVASPAEANFKAGDYFVKADAIGTEIKASELADVGMTPSEDPIVFTAGKGTTSANVAYKLGKATRQLKADEFIDFGTEAADLEDMFELTAVGGYSAFTIDGAMNTNTEWSKLETKTITITPTYEFEDSTGLEEAVATGLNQIEAEAAAPTPTTYALTLNTENGNLWYQFEDANKPTGEFTDVVINGTSRPGQVGGNIVYMDSGRFIVTAAAVSFAEFGITENNTTIVATIGGTEYTFTY